MMTVFEKAKRVKNGIAFIRDAIKSQNSIECLNSTDLRQAEWHSFVMLTSQKRHINKIYEAKEVQYTIESIEQLMLEASEEEFRIIVNVALNKEGLEDYKKKLKGLRYINAHPEVEDVVFEELPMGELDYDLILEAIKV